MFASRVFLVVPSDCIAWRNPIEKILFRCRELARARAPSRSVFSSPVTSCCRPDRVFRATRIFDELAATEEDAHDHVAEHGARSRRRLPDTRRRMVSRRYVTLLLLSYARDNFYNASVRGSVDSTTRRGCRVRNGFVSRKFDLIPTFCTY